MLNKKVEDLMNRQIEREVYSSNLYLAMASWVETEGYQGISQWLYAQAAEEHDHMMKFIAFVNERGGHAVIPQVDKPAETYGDIKSMFNEVLKHEQYITSSIDEIMQVCVEEKDFAGQNWLQWFITEQMEEESSVSAIIDRLNLIGEQNMYMFDRDIMSMRGSN